MPTYSSCQVTLTRWRIFPTLTSSSFSLTQTLLILSSPHASMCHIILSYGPSHSSFISFANTVHTPFGSLLLLLLLLLLKRSIFGIRTLTYLQLSSKSVYYHSTKNAALILHRYIAIWTSWVFVNMCIQAMKIICLDFFMRAHPTLRWQ